MFFPLSLCIWHYSSLFIAEKLFEFVHKFYLAYDRLRSFVFVKRGYTTIIRKKKRKKKGEHILIGIIF